MVRQLWSTLVHGRWCSYYIQIISFLLLSADTFAREVTGVNGERKLLLLISIHTSARKVTRISRWVDRYYFISIHTSAREVTWKCYRKYIWFIQFQSTLPQGKWLRPPVSVQVGPYFNPHFRKGSDAEGHTVYDCTDISIHTSAREVTICVL